MGHVRAGPFAGRGAGRRRGRPCGGGEVRHAARHRPLRRGIALPRTDGALRRTGGEGHRGHRDVPWPGRRRRAAGEDHLPRQRESPDVARLPPDGPTPDRTGPGRHRAVPPRDHPRPAAHPLRLPVAGRGLRLLRPELREREPRRVRWRGVQPGGEPRGGPVRAAAPRPRPRTRGASVRGGSRVAAGDRIGAGARGRALLRPLALVHEVPGGAGGPGGGPGRPPLPRRARGDRAHDRRAGRPLEGRVAGGAGARRRGEPRRHGGRGGRGP